MNRPSHLLVAVLFVHWLAVGPVSRACNIPVFRYALENWRPDPYLVFVLHRGELDAAQQELVAQLRAASGDSQRPANLDVHVVDIEHWRLESSSAEPSETPQLPPPMIEFLTQAIAGPDLNTPQLVALYPATMGHPAVAWQGTLDADPIRSLLDSPLRQQVAQRLLSGQSAVWVLIESGDAAADDEAHARLEVEVARLKSQIELPAREVIESDEYYRPEVEIDLRVDFSTVRVRRDDPQEAAFASMLLGSEADLRDFKEPIAIPIYGRGRTYFALVGKGINAEMIEENCRFLCGACSCVVKEQNPGIDMLLAVDWDHQVVGSAMPELVLPELTGVGALDVAETAPAETEDVAARVASSAASSAVVPAVPTSDASDVPAGAGAAAAAAVTPSGEVEVPTGFEAKLLLWLLGIVATGLVLAIAATVLLRRQASVR